MFDHLAIVLSLLMLATPTDQAIKDLGSTDWRTRERATFLLRSRADKLLIQQLQKAMCESKDLEVQHRAEQIIAWYEWKNAPPTVPSNPIDQFNQMMPIGGFFKIFWPIQQGN